MCWYTGNKELGEPRIAEEDIKVYKIVELDEDEILSYYQGFSYGSVDCNGAFSPRKELLKKKLYFKSDLTIGNGYHSYSAESKITVFYEEDTALPEDLYIANTQYPFLPFIKVMECIIPKGAEFFINEYKEIVSEIIKPIRIFDLQETEGTFSGIYR